MQHGEVGFNADLPFSRKIMDEPISANFKMPQLEAYDGATDSVDRLKSFKVLVLLY